jgi:teichuronic acid biosynthesis glycosyltransferase TuaH
MIVICAGTPFDGHRFSERQLADPLSRHVPVLYVDPPVSILHSRRRPSGPRLQQISQQLWRLSIPTPPGPHRQVLARVAGRVMRRALRRAVADLECDVAAVLLATTAPLFGVSGEALRVLWGTDDFVAGAELMGVSARRLRAEERRRLREADLALTVSTALGERWRAAGVDSRLFLNGVEYDLFSACDKLGAPEDVVLPPPIAGYFGHLSDRIDLRLLESVASHGHSLLLVGPCQATFDMKRLDRLLRLPNVQWVPGRPMAELPAYLGLIDVGLVPYTNTPFNRASFPLKTLEYLAGGRAVVSTPLPAVDLLETDLVTCAGDEESFANEVERLLGQQATPELVEQRRSFAQGHSWEHRAEQLLELITSRRRT